MRLLLVTQRIDERDSQLGFFTRWIEALASHFECIEAICLEEGVYSLPKNVRVHSLGKERGARSRASYTLRFLKLAWVLRRRYDAAFVHMNEEYVLVAGILWKLLGKRVYMWRNHYAGSWKTHLASRLSTKVFYTSRSSYTARFPNSVQMPVGVDTQRFAVSGTRAPGSILFLGRFSPAKKPHVLIEALGLLAKDGIAFSASFYGDALPRDAAYRAQVEGRVRDLGLSNVHFYPGIPHADTPQVFAAHEIYVNLAESGMFDKTLFEAASSGCLVLAYSSDWKDLMVDERVGLSDPAPREIADRLSVLMTLSEEERAALIVRGRKVAASQDLSALIARLSQELGAV